MTVYVDNAFIRWRYMIMCHMVADTEEELHEMADAIGVGRRWYQGNHYDICKAKRVLAVRLGAVEVDVREIAKLRWRMR